jgi:chalcone isomerase-like protein
MRRSLPVVLVSAMIALSVGTVLGKECHGVNFPEQIQVQTSPLTLNGLGLRQATMLKINVYVAALYVAQKSTDANALLASPPPKQLVLHFVRDVDSADLKKAWEEGFASNAKAQLPALKERIEKLKAWMVDMQSGQKLTFTHKPGAGIEVDINGTVKGTVEGDDFAKAFLSIWLGAKPPNPGLKAGLLGGTCS